MERCHGTVGLVLLLFGVVIPLAHGQEIGHGTAVVVLRSPKILVAAVDSRENYRQYGQERTEPEARTICKVARIGPYFAIVAGLAHGSNGFNALGEAEHAWHQGDSLRGLALRTRDALPVLLLPLLNAIKEAEPVDFYRRYQNQPAVQMTFLGGEGRQTEVVVVELVVVDSALGPAGLSARIAQCPGDCPNSPTAWFLGAHDRIDEFLRRNTTFIGHPDERRAEALLKLEYADRPDLVGGPVSLIRIGKAGSGFVRSGACAVD